MAEGIILAGGFSSRAGTNKMTLEYEEIPLIEHAIEAMKPFVSRIVVISGHHHEDLVYLDERRFIKLVYNPDYEKGMFTSVKLGAAEVDDDMFIIPGDYPLVSRSTYRALLDAHGVIRVPVYKQKKGHPLFIEASLRTALSNSKAPHLKAFRDHYPVTTVPVGDEGVLVDVDTLDDFQRLKKSRKGAKA